MLLFLLRLVLVFLKRGSHVLSGGAGPPSPLSVLGCISSPPPAAGQLGVAGRQGPAAVHLGTLEPASQLHTGGHRQRHGRARLGHAEHEVSDTPVPRPRRPFTHEANGAEGFGARACLSAPRWSPPVVSWCVVAVAAGAPLAVQGCAWAPRRWLLMRGRWAPGTPPAPVPRGGPRGRPWPWWQVSGHRFCAVG